MEPESNIQHICSEHAPQPDPRLAEIPLSDFLGSWVKLAFLSTDGGTEHMWVKISGFNDDYLYGVLDNDPVRPMDLKCGDAIAVHRTEIESWISPVKDTNL